MKLFEYLKGRLLPPSSRSFHELFSEVIGLRHDICELSRQLESLRADLQQFDRFKLALAQSERWTHA